MPRLSDTMEEGAISTWRKHPGDTVAVGDVLVEIETDKAVMEYEAYQAGTLSQILVDEGQVAQIGAAIALIDDGTGGVASATPTSATPTSALISIPTPTEADNSKMSGGDSGAVAAVGTADRTAKRRREGRCRQWHRGHPADRLAAGPQACPGEQPRPVPGSGDRPRWPDHPGRHQRPAVRRPGRSRARNLAQPLALPSPRPHQPLPFPPPRPTSRSPSRRRGPTSHPPSRPLPGHGAPGRRRRGCAIRNDWRPQ